MTTEFKFDDFIAQAEAAAEAKRKGQEQAKAEKLAAKAARPVKQKKLVEETPVRLARKTNALILRMAEMPTEKHRELNEYVGCAIDDLAVNRTALAEQTAEEVNALETIGSLIHGLTPDTFDRLLIVVTNAVRTAQIVMGARKPQTKQTGKNKHNTAPAAQEE